MLMLAGVLGLIAAGAVAMVDFSSDANEETEEDPVSGEAEGAETSASSAWAGFADIEEPPANGAIIAGTEADGAITGTAGGDQIGGYAGNDAIWGADGNDDLHGMSGLDTLAGDAGQDTIFAGGGDDIAQGGAGDDAIFGQSNDDTLAGGPGADDLHGGDGYDLLIGHSGDDALQGGLGNDCLIGGSGQDALFGGWGHDLVDGRDGPAPAPDFVNGGGGDDTLIAGAFDSVTAGSGADHILLGDWIDPDDGPARVLDFNPDEDMLVVVYDDAQPTLPRLSLGRDADLPEMTQVLLENRVIAEVRHPGDLTAEDIALLPMSLAKTSGMPVV